MKFEKTLLNLVNTHWFIIFDQQTFGVTLVQTFALARIGLNRLIVANKCSAK